MVRGEPLATNFLAQSFMGLQPSVKHEPVSGAGSSPAPLVAQVFNLCTRTGKIPVPPKTFRNWIGGL